MNTIASQLHAAIAAVCPIVGISPGNEQDKMTWRVDFADGTSFRYGDTPKEQRHTDVAAVIRDFVPSPPRRLVLKSVIIARLNAAGKLAAAKAELDANLYARERWYVPDRPAVYADDPEVLALLRAIGADPAMILAP